MDPDVPPPPRSGAVGVATTSNAAGPGASCTAASYHPATELPPSTTTTTTVVTPGTDQEHKTTISSTPQECILGGVHHSASEEDVKIFGKPVHVHGSLAKHEPVHPPVHHDPHGIVNYAKAAKEEMHELHEHPRGVGVGEVLLPGAKTGVEMWDKVSKY